MSQKTIRNLVIFLLINAVLAIYITGNYFFKSLDEKEILTETKKPVVEFKATETVVKSATIIPEVKKVENFPKEVVSAPIVTAQPIVVSETSHPIQTNESKSIQDSNKICVEMGPLNSEEKSTMDFILAKNKQVDLAKVEKLQSHQLFWNLGKNKSDAEKLFSKQKDGAMANSKFILAQNTNKDWIVNITKVHGSEDVAKKLLKDLEDKAQKINAGGTWQYSTLPEGYFYKFHDYKSLKEVTVNSIEIMLKAPKDPC